MFSERISIMKLEHNSTLIKELVKIPLNFFIYLCNILIKKQHIDNNQNDIIFHFGYFLISLIFI